MKAPHRPVDLTARRAKAMAALVVGLLVAAAVALTMGRGSSPGAAHQAHPARPLPSFAAPVVSGGPSVANFCAVLAGDVGELSQLGQAKGNAQIVEVLERYVAAAPAIATEAPAPIATAAQLYVAETTTIYEAMARTNLRPGVVNAALLRPFDSAAAQGAEQEVRSYAQARCGFDPQDPPAAAAHAR